MSSVLSVVVGDDHPVVRDGVVRMLAADPGIEVVAEADDGLELLAAIRALAPDVAVTDFSMPGLDGAQVAAAVQREGLPTRVLVLSAYTESALVYAAMAQGAAGFLSKEARREQILQAVRDVAAGIDVLPAELTAGLLAEVRARQGGPGPILSARQQQVLVAMAAGKSVPAIAKELFLAPSTVKTNIQRLYDKLGVSDRGAAVAEGMRRHLLD